MIENGLRALRSLEPVEILSPLLESCKHKVDLPLLNSFGFTVKESNQIVLELDRTNTGSFEFKELLILNPEFIKKIAAEKISRSITIWIKFNRLLQYHNLNCHRFLDLDDDLKSRSINNIGLGFKPEVYNSIMHISNSGIPLRSIGFSTRTFNALKRNNVQYLDDLLKLTDKDLSNFQNLGTQSIQEIVDVLSKFKATEIVKLSEPIVDFEGHILLENLGLSTRTYNALKRNEINTLNDLINTSETDLKDIRNLGTNSLKEINEVLLRFRNQNVPQNSVNLKGEYFAEELYSWARSELLKEIDSLATNIFSLKDLQIKLKYFESDMFTNRGEYYFELYFGCDTVGAVTQKLLEQISRTSGEDVEILINQLDSFQSDINQYLEYKENLFPNAEVRDSILKYENDNSDESLDLLQFDKFTLDLIGLNSKNNEVLLENGSFFELLENLNHNFIRDNNVWDLLGRVLEFFKVNNSFPNLSALIVSHYLGVIEDKSNIERQLEKVFKSIFSENGERNFQVLLMRINGDSLESIGKKFDLTRERIRQILVKISPDLEILTESLRTVIKTKFDKQQMEKFLEIFERYGAIYKSELAAELGLSEEEAINSTPKQFHKYIIDKTSEPVSQMTWTLEASLKAIREAGTYYYPLRQSDYDYLVSIGEIKGPSIASMYQRQWQWSDLCLKAGVEFVPSVRSEYVRTWSNEELLSFARRFFLETSISGSYGSYDSWRELQIDHVPSGVLIRNVFGSWTNVKRKALESIRYEKGLNVRDDI
jgi:hypothetical protein